MPDEQREGLQEELIDIILLVLKRNPQLHYYQGYHDIVVTFLLVLGERLATALVEKLSTHHLRCFLLYFQLIFFFFSHTNQDKNKSFQFSLQSPSTSAHIICFVSCFFLRQGLHGSYHGQHKTHSQLFDANY